MIIMWKQGNINAHDVYIYTFADLHYHTLNWLYTYIVDIIIVIKYVV